tara:strand:- start:529 stop:2277 length:1749 start_codon:yes stop_codon:yes gene_type:complete
MIEIKDTYYNISDTSTYFKSTIDTITINSIQSITGMNISWIPIRCRISPSGLLMFIVGLLGDIVLLERKSVTEKFKLQKECLIYMNILNDSYKGERGAYSVILPPDFDETSEDDKKKNIFVTIAHNDDNNKYEGVANFKLNFKTYHNFIDDSELNKIKLYGNGMYYSYYLDNDGYYTSNDEIEGNLEIINMTSFNIIKYAEYYLELTIKNDKQININISLFDLKKNKHRFLKPNNIENLSNNENKYIFDIISDEEEIRLLDIVIWDNKNNIVKFKDIVFKKKNIYKYKDFNVIYKTSDESKHPAGAHQITDGYCKNDKLYIVQGDGFQEYLAQDENSYRGKILKMNYDGTNLKIVAKGLRNEFSLIPLDKDLDIYERVLAIGNGHNVGRIWFSIIPENYIINMGWGANGDNNSNPDGSSWKSFSYQPNPNDNIAVPEGILKLFDNDPSPNGLAIHIINGRILVFFCCFGKFEPPDYDRSPYEKTIYSAELINLGNQPTLISFNKILETKVENDIYNEPLTIEWDKYNDTLYVIELNGPPNNQLVELKFNNFDSILLDDGNNNEEELISNYIDALKKLIKLYK